jgi:hypothetical protein
VLKGLPRRHDLQVLVRLPEFKVDELFPGMDPQIGGPFLSEMGSGLLFKQVPYLVKFKLNRCGCRVQFHVKPMLNWVQN